MRVEGAVGGLRLRHLADAALEEGEVAEGVGGDAGLDAGVAPPLGLLARRTIDEGVKAAIELGVFGGFPDLREARIAAFEGADVLEGCVDLAQADVADLQTGFDVAKDDGGVAQADVLEGFEALRAGAAAVAKGGGFFGGAGFFGSVAE